MSFRCETTLILTKNVQLISQLDPHELPKKRAVIKSRFFLMLR
jgi:hypothetical protein